MPAPALPINGLATLGFFLPTDITAGDAGAGCREDSLAGPSVRVRVSVKRAQFIPRDGSPPLRRTSSIKRSEYSGTNELGTGYQVLRPRHPASGQQSAGTSYSPSPRRLHRFVPQRAPKVTGVHVPLRGPSPVSATSAPNKHDATWAPRV